MQLVRVSRPSDPSVIFGGFMAETNHTVISYCSQLQVTSNMKCDGLLFDTASIVSSLDDNSMLTFPEVLVLIG